MKIIPGEVATKDLHQFLLGSVSPRPICFASTVDADGNNNLAPYSFFGVFGSNPPTLIFSPARRVRNNTVKHTLENILETKEVVVNVVSYDIVQQMNLASSEYPAEVDEFVKAGFTPVPSEKIKAMRVKESPVSMECIVNEVISTGDHGGAGNLIICEVVCMHIDDAILDANNLIDPDKIDLVGRMGRDYYCRASGAAVFTVDKPNPNLGMGIDQLPETIKNSKILTGNDLARLASLDEIPKNIVENGLNPSNNDESHTQAKALIAKGLISSAWQKLFEPN